MFIRTNLEVFDDGRAPCPENARQVQMLLDWTVRRRALYGRGSNPGALGTCDSFCKAGDVSVQDLFVKI